MRLKNLIIIFVLVLMCSGCSNIKYSLKFDKDIEEYMTFTDEHINQEDELDSMDSMPGMSAVEYLLQSLPYNSGSDSKGNYYVGKHYGKIADINESIIFRYISKDCLSINGTKIQINILGSDLIDVGNIGKLEINLYIPYYVSKHNADMVSNNTYKWIIDDFNNDKITINFDMSKNANYQDKIILYCVIGIVVIVLICVIIYFVNKNKKANEL